MLQQMKQRQQVIDHLCTRTRPLHYLIMGGYYTIQQLLLDILDTTRISIYTLKSFDIGNTLATHKLATLEYELGTFICNILLEDEHFF